MNKAFSKIEILYNIHMQREQWPTNQSKIRIRNHISTHSTTQQP